MDGNTCLVCEGIEPFVGLVLGVRTIELYEVLISCVVSDCLCKLITG